MTANKTYWYLIEFTCNTSISSRFTYVIAKTMEDACKRVREIMDIRGMLKINTHHMCFLQI